MTMKPTGTARPLLAASMAAAMLVVSGCSTTKPRAEPMAKKTSPAPPSQATVAPRLVVLIVIDQLGSWVLDQQLRLLPSGSAIRRAYEDGASHIAEFPYASTQTAPGHASLGTGVTPAVHGVVANAVYSPGRGSKKTVDDGKHAVLGNPDRFVSPTQLRAETVGDVLHRQSGGKARIVGISIKGRSAVLPVGQKPDIAVFYDAVAHAMTTSTYYAPKRRLPEWLRDFRKANPVGPLLQTWEPVDPVALEKHLGPDASPGEMYPTFPHDPRNAPDPWYAFAGTPESSEYLMAAAYAVVKAEQMGIDDVPDFLVLGVSGTDIVGHVWGARSWEYADNLRRMDRALTHFVRLLEARGPVAFVLTADHGVAELPERARAEGRAGGRLSGAALTSAAELAADAALGGGDWIAGYVPPLFSYTDAGKARHKDLTRALRKAMPDIEGVKVVYDARDPAKLRSSNSKLERLVGASLPDDPPGDLYLVTEPGWFDALSEQGGTNHGTPWDYDRRVPVLMWGTAVERRTSQDIYDVLRVATTLAALLNVPAPANAPESPLPGVMRLPD
ncbi:MAG: alkaline phosphatase family protein [Deltaproteobacteria bacterium]|nr:alkaline phosphatase family protein [Deltaproteobacteria bacterium]